MRDAPSSPSIPVSPATASPGGDTRQGFLLALAAYLFWGVLPLYMKALAHLPVTEVVAHRIAWSVPIALAVLVYRGRTADLRRAFATPTMLFMGVATAALIGVNWGIYVWAITSGHALDAALGYYINPLFSIFLGATILGERLSRLRLFAIALAVVGVAILTWEAGRLPLVALGLTVTWGFYALLKRRLPIGPNQGFALEVLILLPPALAYILWLTLQGSSHFLAGTPTDDLLFLGCGLITAIPLMVYANAAKGLTLSTIAVMQYIAPTMIFLLAVFVFDEPFSMTKLVAFGFIWSALVAYSAETLRPR